MKKSTIIILCLLLASIVGASTYYVTVVRKGKVGKVSEDPAKPTPEKPLISNFVYDYMASKYTTLTNIIMDSSDDARLANLGFTSKANLPYNKALAVNLKKLHDAYALIYPTKQFVTFGCVAELLKKYELSLGYVNAYTGPIPTWAIDSMEKFRPSYLFSRTNEYPMHDHDQFDELVKSNFGYGNLRGYEQTLVKIESGEGYLGREKDIVKYALLDMKKRTTAPGFMIIAPKEYFNGEQSKDGVFGAPPPNKDPIVLEPVEGGYIIVTAW